MSATNGRLAPKILRLGHPLAFAAYLRRMGAPVERHFRRQGLPTLCEDPNAFVPLGRVWAFFDAAAQHIDPNLGWRVGQFVGERSLNATLLSKLKHAPTLYQALKKFIRLSTSDASHVRLGIQERRDDILFFTEYQDMKGMPGYSVSQSYQLGLIRSLIRHFCGENWNPEEIGIEHPVVPGVAEEIFSGSRILARQRTGYIAIPRSCLHLPPPPPVLESHGGEESSLVLKGKLDYPSTIRVLLKPFLSEGYPDASLSASLMDTSVRTLERRLSEYGTTYRALINGLRFDEAKRLLEQTDAQIIDVAAAVGFEDPANFTRMFRRIGGVCPREFRRNRR